jgi:hypothetical protein
MKNSCEAVNDETTMLAFIAGLNKGTLLRHTLTHERDARTLTLNGMIQTANSFTAADDDARGSLMGTALPNQSMKNHKRKNLPKEKKNSDMVAMTFQGRGQGVQHGAGRGQQCSDEITHVAPLRLCMKNTRTCLAWHT